MVKAGAAVAVREVAAVAEVAEAAQAVVAGRVAAVLAAALPKNSQAQV